VGSAPGQLLDEIVSVTCAVQGGSRILVNDREDMMRAGRLGWLLCAQPIVVGLYLLLLVLPSGFIPDGFRDELVGNGVLALATLVVVVRGIRHREDRWWSWCLAVGLGSFTVGDVLYANVVQFMDPAPYPSAADFGYIGLYPSVVAALILFVRRGTVRVRRSMLLDGLVAGLALAAFAGAFVAAPLVAQSTDSAYGGWLQIAVAAAYPVCDVALVAMVIGVFVLRGGRPGFYGWIAAGLATFALADTIYLYRVANDSYVTGTPLDGLWAIGLSVVAAGVWRPRRDADHNRVTTVWTLAAPVSSVLLAIGVLVWASVDHTPFLVVLLAAATLVAATGRIIDGFVAVRDFARVLAEARTDELTGLGNRRYLYEAIEVALRGAGPQTPVYLALIDLDRFKEVNDSIGHVAGDEVLITVANRLRAVTEPADVLARLGGDEFAVLLAGRGDDFPIMEWAGRVGVEIAAPIVVAGLSLQVGSSIGIATAPVDSLDRIDLVRHADVAMYDAKRIHAGAARYDATRDNNSREGLQLIGELRQALTTDPGQIIVHYQPKTTLTGEIVGAEALVRWQHPTRGLLGPEAFIQTVENHSLMPALTRQVMQTALAQCRRWRCSDPRATVSVNLSATSLLDDNLTEQVATALVAADLTPDALTIEITESMIMLDPERSRRTLQALHEHGVKLSIDDYGTGQCSLAYLRDLPVQELKLDRTFVRFIAIRQRDAAIVRSTVDLAHSLGLELVAEGVEDLAAVMLLREMGCDFAQGYYFGRPAPGAPTLAETGTGGQAPDRHRIERSSRTDDDRAAPGASYRIRDAGSGIAN
jgi:diguanylate cyclase (GGDEF)-like protein